MDTNHYGLEIDLDEHRRKVVPRLPVVADVLSVTIIEAVNSNGEIPDPLDALAEAQYANPPAADHLRQ